MRFFSLRDQKHCNWAKSWVQLLTELQAYVKQNHTTGVTWNNTKRSKVFDVANLDKTGPVKSGSAPPPPPPPPPALFDLSSIDQDQGGKSVTEALFAEINKGDGITKGLKKVTDDQKTHKNPNLRANAVVPAKDSSAKKSAAPSATTAVVKPPLLELQDKLWKVEYFNKKHDLLIDQTDLKQAVYMYKCSECTITIKGKISSISLDNCSRVALIFDDILSKVDFVYCRDVQMQANGKVPVISIEKSDGCQIYLSKSALDVEIVSSQSVAMNVYVPKDEEGDFDELPIPQQFKTVINQNKRQLVTTPTEAV